MKLEKDLSRCIVSMQLYSIGKNNNNKSVPPNKDEVDFSSSDNCHKSNELNM